MHVEPPCASCRALTFSAETNKSLSVGAGGGGRVNRGELPSGVCTCVCLHVCLVGGKSVGGCWEADATPPANGVISVGEPGGVLSATADALWE